MTDFNEQEFLEWLNEIDGYYVSRDRIGEEWPDFYEYYNLTGVTVKMEDGKVMVPKVDYRDAVELGTVGD